MSSVLADARVVLAVSGGIAVYKSADIVRECMRRKANVSVVMTRNATRFVDPLTFQTLSVNRVVTDMWAVPDKYTAEHISLADWADIVVVAPATANIIGKYVAGIADDFVSTFLIAVKAPVLIAPAMHEAMYLSPAVQENIARLTDRGVQFVGPVEGPLAAGAIGLGRMVEPLTVVERMEEMLAKAGDLAGRTVLVTAGPTQEPLDPVRHLSNRSSGKMGYAVAAVARRRGAKVILVSGPTTLRAPKGVELVPVVTALEMCEAVRGRFEEADVLIKAAAVSDFRPKRSSAKKVRKEDAELVVELERNPDILEEVGSRKGRRIVVGFAAETDDILKRGRKKLEAKNLDFIVVNDVRRQDIGFASDENEVHIIGRGGDEEALPRMPKEQVAAILLDKVAAALRASVGE